MRVVLTGAGPLRPCGAETSGLLEEVALGPGNGVTVRGAGRVAVDRGVGGPVVLAAELIHVVLVVLVHLEYEGLEDSGRLPLPRSVILAQGLLPLLQRVGLLLEELLRPVERLGRAREGGEVDRIDVLHHQVVVPEPPGCPLQDQLVERRFGSGDVLRHRRAVPVVPHDAFERAAHDHAPGIEEHRPAVVVGGNPDEHDPSPLHAHAAVRAVAALGGVEDEVVVLALVGHPATESRVVRGRDRSDPHALEPHTEERNLLRARKCLEDFFLSGTRYPVKRVTALAHTSVFSLLISFSATAGGSQGQEGRRREGQREGFVPVSCGTWPIRPRRQSGHCLLSEKMSRSF